MATTLTNQAPQGAFYWQANPRQQNASWQTFLNTPQHAEKGSTMSTEAKIKRKTVTMERYHIYGTRHHSLRLMYKGRTLFDLKQGIKTPLDVTDHGPESIAEIMRIARNRGFTHVKVVGEWDRRTKPKNGAL